MKLEELYNRVTKDLENLAIKKFGSKESYIKKRTEFYEENGYYIYGLRVPESDKIIKKYTKEFKELSFKERLTLSEKFYYSKCSGQTNFGLKLLEMSLNQLKPENFEFLDKIVDSFFIWGPTDSFSLYIMQPLLKKCPEKTKQLLKKWNNSSHIWKKRASVVTFTRKLGEEGKYVDFLLELTDNLIWDEEDLVRKGIGWALKDNMKGKNKEKVLNYVKNLRKMGVSSVITLYAIRKLKGKEREEVLKIKPSK